MKSEYIEDREDLRNIALKEAQSAYYESIKQDVKPALLRKNFVKTRGAILRFQKEFLKKI